MKNRTVEVDLCYTGMTNFWPREADHLLYQIVFKYPSNVSIQTLDTKIRDIMESLVAPDALWIPPMTTAIRRQNWPFEREVYTHDLDWIMMDRLMNQSGIAEFISRIQVRLTPLISHWTLLTTNAGRISLKV